jgi:hypothetical protein
VSTALCFLLKRTKRQPKKTRPELHGKWHRVCFRLVEMEWVGNVWLFDQKNSYLKSPRFVHSPEYLFLEIMPGKSSDVGRKKRRVLNPPGLDAQI